MRDHPTNNTATNHPNQQSTTITIVIWYRRESHSHMCVLSYCHYQASSIYTNDRQRQLGARERSL